MKATSFNSRFLLMLAAFVTAGVVFFCAQPPDSADIRDKVIVAGLSVPSNSLELGVVWAQRNLRCSIPVTNETQHDIVVANVTASCNCADVSPTQFTVRAGDTLTLEVTLNVLTTRDDDGRRESVPFAASIIPHVVDPQSTGDVDTWTLRGTIRKPLSYTPALLNFPEGSLIRGGKPVEAILDVRLHNGVSGLRVVPASDGISCQVAGGRDPRHCSVKVMPDMDLACGYHSFVIDLIPVSRDGTELPRIPLAGSAVIVDDVQCLPPSVFLRADTDSTHAECTVELSSRTKSPFVVDMVETENDLIVVTPMSEGDMRQAKRFVLSARETPAEGFRRASVRFRVTHPDGSAYAVELPVTVAFVRFAPSLSERKTSNP